MTIPLRYNIRGLFQHKTRSLLTLLGVAVVVFISVLMTGLSRGLIAYTIGSASPDNVIVLSLGAETMEFSAISPSEFHFFAHAEQIRRHSGQPLASPEVLLSALVRLPENSASGEFRGVVRGVLPVAFEVHDQVRMVEGTPPGQGFQVIVGQLAATKLGVPREALAIGRSISFEGRQWEIVGAFEAPGTMLDSEIWAYLDDAMIAARRSDYSAVALKTNSPQAADDLVADLLLRTDVRVEAQTEEAYYAAAGNALRPISAVTGAVTIILVLGGIMAGMNTMFNSILGRTREMAMLVVRGYKRTSVLLSFLLESLFLCLAGGAVGAVAGLFLDGLPMAVPMGAFRFIIDAMTLGLGLLLALFIGVVGAVVPLFHVYRQSIVEALQME